MPRPACQSLAEIAALDCPCIRPSDVAGALGCDAYLMDTGVANSDRDGSPQAKREWLATGLETE